jgi:hypothetical protein
MTHLLLRFRGLVDLREVNREKMTFQLPSEYISRET